MRNHPSLPSLAWKKINQCKPPVGLFGLFSVYVIQLFGVQNAQAVIRTWDGGSSANSNWGTKQNWGNQDLVALDDLVFAGTTQLSNNNNTTAGATYNSITFNSGAGAFVLGGNQITLGGNVVNNVATTVQTINLALALNGNRQFNGVLSSVLQVNGTISGTGFGLEKTGAGTVNLTSANTYSGSTTVSAGILEVSGIAGALSNTSSVAINGGTLLLSGSASNRVNNAATVNLGNSASPSKLGVSGTVTEGLGALTLSGTAGGGVRVIDFGNSTSALTFSSLASSVSGLALQIWNWNFGGANQLNVTGGTFTGGNTALADITFYSGAGTGTSAIASWSGNSLVPVPEPGALFAGLALMAPLAWRERRHWMRCRDARVA